MAVIKPACFTIKEGKKILIRSAGLNDAPALLKLMQAVSRERIYSLAEPEEFDETEKSYKKRIDRFNSSPGKLYIVAEFRKKITGLVQFNNFDFKKCSHNGFLTIFISKSWRGKGIGRLLINELLKWAGKNRIIEKVSLSVFSSNTAAIALYRKLGFRREGLCKRDLKINGKYADSVLMYMFV